MRILKNMGKGRGLRYWGGGAPELVEGNTYGKGNFSEGGLVKIVVNGVGIPPLGETLDNYYKKTGRIRTHY